MSSSNPSQEWQRLYELYAKKGDEELLELREDYDDLTDTARECLRDELQRRHLWVEIAPPPTSPPPTSHQTELDPDLGDGWTWLELQQGGVSAATCPSDEDADLCVYVLQRALTQAVVLRREKMDVRPPQVLVAPDDLEKAKNILNQPISDRIRNEYRDQPRSGDFELPSCKNCGSGEILLEAIEPTNQWLCDNCGHTWQDALPADETTS